MHPSTLRRSQLGKHRGKQQRLPNSPDSRPDHRHRNRDLPRAKKNVISTFCKRRLAHISQPCKTFQISQLFMHGKALAGQVTGTEFAKFEHNQDKQRYEQIY
jgi:hypothetical protein